MSTGQSFPRVHQIRFMHSGLEDRMAIRLTMASGEGRVLWLTRRGLVLLMQRLNGVLKQSHPAGEGEAAHDMVMALEHIGARSQIAAQREQEQASADSGEDKGIKPPTEWTHFLLTEALVEVQDETIVLALSGQSLPNEPDLRQDPVPIGGLALTRPHAHEILRLMGANAEQADWNIEQSIGWLKSPKRAEGDGETLG